MRPCALKRISPPIRNAISRPKNSGSVEGNNNKFILLKRIVYGRSGLVNLEKSVNWYLCPRQVNSTYML